MTEVGFRTASNSGEHSNPALYFKHIGNRYELNMEGYREKPVFVIGCARSGTTWLYHLLLSSGGFAIYRSETQLYNYFGPRFGGFSNDRRKKAFLDKWLGSEFFLRSGLDADSFRRDVMRGVNSPGTMLNVLMNRICDEQSATRWAENTPDYAIHIRQIKRDFPDALFIHVVRDGRDVALSLAKKAFVKPFRCHDTHPQLAAAAYWSWVTNSILRQSEYLGNDLLTIHYEDLVENFEVTLSRIANFIGKPIDPGRINSFSIGSVLEPNSSFDRDETEDAAKPRWRKHWTDEELAAVEAIAGRGLGEFGYERYQGSISLKDRISATLIRRAYTALFRLRSIVKHLPIVSRYLKTDFGGGFTASNSNDPTIRPKENISCIRRLVGS